jgi:hypothetical protein
VRRRSERSQRASLQHRTYPSSYWGLRRVVRGRTRALFHHSVIERLMCPNCTKLSRPACQRSVCKSAKVLGGEGKNARLLTPRLVGKCKLRPWTWLCAPWNSDRENLLLLHGAPPPQEQPALVQVGGCMVGCHPLLRIAHRRYRITAPR